MTGFFFFHSEVSADRQEVITKFCSMRFSCLAHFVHNGTGFMTRYLRVLPVSRR